MYSSRSRSEQEKLRIGFDLDGVIATHPMYGFWIWLRKLKEKILKKAHLSKYYYPSSNFERLAWKLISKGKKPFADKDNFFSTLAKKKAVEFFLITGRFKFLQELTQDWLKKHNLDACFQEIMINAKDADPILFKAQEINDLDLDVFIDDDLEVVSHLQENTKARLYWMTSQSPGRKEDGTQVTIVTDVIEALKQILNT